MYTIYVDMYTISVYILYVKNLRWQQFKNLVRFWNSEAHIY